MPSAAAAKNVKQRGDPCQCKKGGDDGEHEPGKCPNFTKERGWFSCSPCGRKWHLTIACLEYYPGREGWDYTSADTHVAPCKTCGYGKDAHA